jgi:hypothetical protein
LAPATIAFSAASEAIVNIINSPAADPNVLWHLQARNDAELVRAADAVLPFLAGRRSALSRHLAAAADEDASFVASEKTRTFWTVKLAATDAFIAVFEHARTPREQLAPEDAAKRDEYFGQAKVAWETGLKEALLALSNQVIGPLSLGKPYVG